MSTALAASKIQSSRPTGTLLPLSAWLTGNHTPSSSRKMAKLGGEEKEQGALELSINPHKNTPYSPSSHPGRKRQLSWWKSRQRGLLQAHEPRAHTQQIHMNTIYGESDASLISSWVSTGKCSRMCIAAPSALGLKCKNSCSVPTKLINFHF